VFDFAPAPAALVTSGMVLAPCVDMNAYRTATLTACLTGLFTAALVPSPAQASSNDGAISMQSATACYEQARKDTGLNQQQARALCLGARGTGPATCFVAADDRTLLSDSPSIKLCRCALGTKPVDCFERADEKTDLTEHQIVRSCSPIVVRNLTTDCVQRED